MQLDGVPVLSCLTLAAQADGREVRTVEGLGDARELLGELSAIASIRVVSR